MDIFHSDCHSLILNNIEWVQNREKMKDLSDLFPEFNRRVQTVLCSEKGQTLAEHSLLLGISGAISSAIGILQDRYLIITGIVMVLLISLLFWKPKLFLAIVLATVLLAVLLFIHRWVEYGHI